MPVRHTSSARLDHVLLLQAKESYQTAVDLEPDDAHLLEGLQKADVAERKQAEQNKHKFKRKDVPLTGTDKTSKVKKPKVTKSGLLSFGDEEM